MTEPAPAFLHASALVIGDAGLLIRGASGSGKSSLALLLLAGAARDGRFARLVGDDRIGLAVRAGRLIARPHPAIAGQIEVRGVGLLAVEHEPACVIRLVVDLATDPSQLGARHPDRPPVATLHGVACPVLVLPAANGVQDNAGRVLALMGALQQTQGGTSPICLPIRLQCTR